MQKQDERINCVINRVLEPIIHTFNNTNYLKYRPMEAKYIRISTAEQNTDRQEVTNMKMYIDTCSGSTPFAERPKSGALLRAVQSGKVNHIFVHSVDRLGRNAADIRTTLDSLQKLKCQVSFESMGINMLDKNFKVTGGFNILVAVMAELAQAELEQLKERQRQGIEAAKLKGKYKGRKTGAVLSNEEIILKHADIAELLTDGKAMRRISELTKKNISTVQKISKAMKVIVKSEA